MLHLARWTSSAAVLLVLLPASGGARATQEVVERHPSLSHEEEPGAHIEEPEALGPTRCQGGSAGPFPCSNVDLLSFMPLSSIGGDGTTHGNDLMGLDGSSERERICSHGAHDGHGFRGHHQPGRSPLRWLATGPDAPEHLARPQGLQELRIHRLGGPRPRHAGLRSEAVAQGRCSSGCFLGGCPGRC